jgi:hypothetical protein
VQWLEPVEGRALLPDVGNRQPGDDIVVVGVAIWQGRAINAIAPDVQRLGRVAD